MRRRSCVIRCRLPRGTGSPGSVGSKVGSSSGAAASSASRGRQRLLDRLAGRVQRHPGLAVAHLAQRELQLALPAEVAHAQLLELVRARGRRDRGRRLCRQRLRVHGGETTSPVVHVLLRVSWVRGTRRPDSKPEVRLHARRPGEPGPRKELLRVRGHVLTIARHERLRRLRADLRRLVGAHDRGRRLLRRARPRDRRAARRARGRERPRRDPGRARDRPAACSGSTRRRRCSRRRASG